MRGGPGLRAVPSCCKRGHPGPRLCQGVLSIRAAAAFDCRVGCALCQVAISPTKTGQTHPSGACCCTCVCELHGGSCLRCVPGVERRRPGNFFCRVMFGGGARGRTGCSTVVSNAVETGTQGWKGGGASGRWQACLDSRRVHFLMAAPFQHKTRALKQAERGPGME